MSLPDYATLQRAGAQVVSLEGPNSGGGRFVAVLDQRVYLVAYGDESTLPGGAEQVTAAYSPAEARRVLERHPAWPRLQPLI